MSDFLKRCLIQGDPRLGKTEKQDWPIYDQYLGMLLAGWSVQSAREVISRNKQRRLRIREPKSVRFLLPEEKKPRQKRELIEDELDQLAQRAMDRSRRMEKKKGVK